MNYILDILEDRIYSTSKAFEVADEINKGLTDFVRKDSKLIKNNRKYKNFLTDKKSQNESTRREALKKITGKGEVIGALGGTALGGGISYLATKKLREKIKANEEELKQNPDNRGLFNQIVADKRKLKLILLGGSTAGLALGAVGGTQISKLTKGYKDTNAKHDKEKGRLQRLDDAHSRAHSNRVKKNLIAFRNDSDSKISEFTKALTNK